MDINGTALIFGLKELHVQVHDAMQKVGKPFLVKEAIFEVLAHQFLVGILQRPPCYGHPHLASGGIEIGKKITLIVVLPESGQDRRIVAVALDLQADVRFPPQICLNIDDHS